MFEITPKSILYLLPIFFLLYNAWRGKNKIKRWQFGLLILVTVFASFWVAGGLRDWQFAAKCAAALAAFGFWWSVWGWGRYFCAGHGDVQIWNDEREEIIVDAIVDRIFGRDLQYPSEAKLAGTVAMCLRAYSFYPAFALIAWFSGSSLPVIIGLAIFAQGAFYWISGLIYAPYGADFISPAEKIFGFYLGCIIAATGWSVL